MSWKVRRYRIPEIPSIEFVVPIMVALVFVITALLHHLQKNNRQAYVDSWLIPAEFFLLVVSGVALIGVLVFVVVYLFQASWRKVLIGIGSFIATYLLISLGLYLDASTLIYMT